MDDHSPEAQRSLVGPLSRRELIRASLLVGGGVLAGPLLAACGGNNSNKGSAGSGAVPATPAASTAAGAAAGTTALGYTAHTDVRGELTFWHFWGSPVRRNAIRRIIGGFQQQYPGIKVTETFIPFGDIWTKNIAAVTAGSGMPDVIVEDRPELRTRARNNIETNVADLAKRDNVTGQPFWPFTWQEAVVGDGVYGLPYETDIRVLYYNKAAFKDGGLDPDKPPQNWDDLLAYADKLDKKNGNQLQRVAFYPTFGSTGLDQWGWNNGGEWFDKDGNPTINAKPNVDALAWMKKWFDRYPTASWDAFKSSFGNGNQDGFMSGKVAMVVDISGYASQLNFYNPKFTTQDKQDLGYGVAQIPPAAGQKPASFSGGFALSFPRGAKNKDQAWEFMKYATFVGQSSWARDTYSMPTIEQIAKTDTQLNADPNWGFFVKAMDYGRPKAYNQYYPSWSDVLGPATDAVAANKQTPQQAMDEAQKKVEAEIAKNKK